MRAKKDYNTIVHNINPDKNSIDLEEIMENNAADIKSFAEKNGYPVNLAIINESNKLKLVHLKKTPNEDVLCFGVLEDSNSLHESKKRMEENINFIS